MKYKKRILAGLTAAVIAFCAFGCSLDKNARKTSDAFMTGLISRDVPNMKTLCVPTANTDVFSEYVGTTSKDSAVGKILSYATFEMDKDFSYCDKDSGEGNIRYNVTMPDYVHAIAQDPTDLDVFGILLQSAPQMTVTVDVNLVYYENTWYVFDPASIVRSFYGPMYSESYSFAYGYDEAVSEVVWTQSEDGMTLEDVSSLEAQVFLNEDYIATGKTVDLTYQLLSGTDVISEGPVDGDTVFVSVSQTDFDVIYFPAGTYDLVILNNGVEALRSQIETVITDAAFSNRSLYMYCTWNDIDVNGGYYNVSEIEALVTLNSQYVASGRNYSLTFDVEGPDGLSAEGLTSVFDGEDAICTFTYDSELPTGTYTFIFYNNGERVASKSVLVTLNLDSSVYSDAQVATNVVDEDDEANASVLIYATNEVDKSILRNYSDVPVTIVSPAINTYTHVLDAVLASGEDAPDMFVVDNNFVSKYRDSEYTIPVNELGIAYDELRYMYEYTYKFTTDSEGLIHGLAWEITPCAVYYSRTVANNVLGVSDPEDVQRYFASWEAFADTAAAVDDVSGGSVKVVCSIGDIQTAYINGRSNPWIVDDDIYVSDYIADYFDLVDVLTDNELTFGNSPWSTEWTNHMSDRKVLSYWGPMWLGDLFIKNTYSGDWGVVTPPVDYFTSGSWIFTSTYCDMKASAAQLLRDVTMNEDNLMEMIDDGMLVNNINVMNACADNEDFEKSYLDDQNPYPVFAESAWRMNASAIGTNDDAIDALFIETINQYLDNEFSDRDEAIESFTARVEEAGIV